MMFMLTLLVIMMIVMSGTADDTLAQCPDAGDSA